VFSFIIKRVSVVLLIVDGVWYGDVIKCNRPYNELVTSSLYSVSYVMMSSKPYVP
jgi:hypothetical protein